MYQGQSLQEMAATVERQSARKDDLLVDTRDLALLNGSELHVNTKGSSAAIGQLAEYEVTEPTLRQIGAHLGLPAAFVDRLRRAEKNGEDGQKVPHDELRRLLDTNVNTLFREQPSRRMVRTFKPVEGGYGLPHETVSEPGVARAFLSDRYRRRDNDELLEHVLPILGEIPDAQFTSCNASDNALFVKVVAPRIEGEVKAGDVVQAGVMLRNSETGHGSLSIAPFFYRLWCDNGCGTDEIQRHYHVGSHVTADEDSRVFTDATLQKDDEAFFAKVADSVRAAVDQTQFNALLVRLRDAAATRPVDDPQEAIERLSQKLAFTEGEGKSILKHLSMGGDFTAYGMLNAVTRTSQDADDYERATELEVAGGRVLALAGTSEWEKIAA